MENIRPIYNFYTLSLYFSNYLLKAVTETPIAIVIVSISVILEPGSSDSCRRSFRTPSNGQLELSAWTGWQSPLLFRRLHKRFRLVISPARLDLQTPVSTGHLQEDTGHQTMVSKSLFTKTLHLPVANLITDNYMVIWVISTTVWPSMTLGVEFDLWHAPHQHHP
jgi:hypothetical protein